MIWVLAWLGVLALLGAAVQTLVLLYRVLRPLREIKRYTDEILESGLAITRHLDGAEEVVRTRELARALATGLGEQ